MKEKKNLWGGRFKTGADETFVEFNRSFPFDQRLFAHDINGCLAHCRGLENAGVLSSEDSGRIQNGLKALLEKAFADEMFFDDGSAEDVHTFIERNLTNLIGETGKKLHMGRSRNDQVATAFRLWMLDAISETDDVLKKLMADLVDLAEANLDTIMPGYTHLQRAQPVLFAHWCLAYFEMFRRDAERMKEIRLRVNVMPLGSAALAGTSYPIDREAVAKDLGFASVSRNSLDAVSDRDFCVEYVFAASLVMSHLSRLAEDIILYCTTEFGFFELSDAVATGSSLMPQKKNPDSMELVRGKTGRVYGSLMGLLTAIKGLPLAYNKDLQEDKEAVFDAHDTVGDCLRVTSIVLKNLSVNSETTLAASKRGYLNATELADYLCGKGISFRDAHEIAGRIVLYAIDRGVELDELGLEEMREFHEAIGNDVFDALSLENTLLTKNVIGGTSKDRVAEALEEAKKWLQPANH